MPEKRSTYTRYSSTSCHITVELTVANPYKRLAVSAFNEERPNVAAAAAVDAPPADLVLVPTLPANRLLTPLLPAAIDVCPASEAPDSAGGHLCGRHLSVWLYWHSSTFLNVCRNTLLKIV